MHVFLSALAYDKVLYVFSCNGGRIFSGSVLSGLFILIIMMIRFTVDLFCLHPACYRINGYVSCSLCNSFSIFFKPTKEQSFMSNIYTHSIIAGKITKHPT